MITNFDAVKHKTLDEMAVMLTHGGFCCEYCDAEPVDDEHCDMYCTLHCKEWLKKEYAGDV